ncbi:MAG: response regulator [Leptospiraceae bacterium]|nr:response regulator [Leptospiraceae bacterium]MCP5512733.1 response regulator [Leptospiraceae bacterium]
MEENAITHTPILLAEDDPTTSMMFQRFLKKHGYKVDIARDGEEALEKINTSGIPYHVIVTDLEMPKLNGRELIAKIRPGNPWLTIIVMTSDSNPETVIEIMKHGVFDYIVKPANLDELRLKINRAIETSLLKKEKHLYEKEKMVRMEKQLEWYNFKEQKNDTEKYDMKVLHTNIYHNLRTNLSQGAGFGVLISLVEMLETLPEDENGNKLLDKEYMNMLKENAQFSTNVIRVFSILETLTSAKISLREAYLKEIYNLVLETRKKLEKKIALRNHSVSISDWKHEGKEKIILNSQYLTEAIEELMLNAMKFSPPEKSIIVLFYIREGEFQITFLNRFYNPENPKIGIPDEYQNLIFEPFFRLTRLVYSDYETLDYGLGLAKAKVIVQKLGGKITVGNLQDHIGKEPGCMVEFSITFPIVVH